MSRATKIELRVSEDEKASWHLQAQAADLSLSGLIRRLMDGYLDDPYLAVAEAVSPVAGLPSARPSVTTSVDDSAHGEQAPAAPVPATDNALESPGSQLHGDETTATETAAKEPWQPYTPEPGAEKLERKPEPERPDEPQHPSFAERLERPAKAPASEEEDPSHGELTPGRLAFLRGMANNMNVPLQRLVERELRQLREGHYTGAAS